MTSRDGLVADAATASPFEMDEQIVSHFFLGLHQSLRTCSCIRDDVQYVVTWDAAAYPVILQAPCDHALSAANCILSSREIWKLPEHKALTRWLRRAGRRVRNFPRCAIIIRFENQTAIETAIDIGAFVERVACLCGDPLFRSYFRVVDIHEKENP